ncbi:hypothetical protein MMC13_004958 [Lambiella insularis]|nr:hypothetical protein [Lambiella insularis]
MNLFYTIIAVAVLHAFHVLGQFGNATFIDLGYAKYQGIQNTTSGINSWFGIRYARSPTGHLRWQPPQDIELSANYSSSSVLNATVLGPSCPQAIPAWYDFSNFGSTPPSSEDCLLLDILVPINPTSENLAVMVEIHGGGYTVGSSETAQGPGQSLVNQSLGTLIHVSIQYRLGAYGFLAGPEVSENGVANAGLLDQRAALGWVQRHISKFGGDPSKVTLAGGSAGGGSVTHQMVMYGGVANPPFRAVMAEYPWWQSFHNESIQAAQYRLLLNSSGCSDLNCLRSLSSTDLGIATNATYTLGYADALYGYGDFFYGPVVDGTIIRDLPSNEFKQGHFAKVPLFTAREGYEGYIFSNQSETTTVEETTDFGTLFPYAKQSFFTRLYELYPSSAFNSTLFQRQQVFGDVLISCPTYYVATAVSDWGLPVYKLVFDAGNELHAALNPFVESVYTLPTGNNATLASILRDYYVSFATALDPNANTYSGIARPAWPVYQQKTSSDFAVLNITYTTIGASPDPDASVQCDFLHGQSYVVRN